MWNTKIWRLIYSFPLERKELECGEYANLPIQSFSLFHNLYGFGLPGFGTTEINHPDFDCTDSGLYGFGLSGFGCTDIGYTEVDVRICPFSVGEVGNKNLKLSDTLKCAFLHIF